MLDPRALTQLAEIVADVQAILWQESRMLPDDPRQYGQYWNPAKEWEAETVEEIADVLADLRPPDFMPVDLAAQLVRPTVIDANELLWAARILASLVRVHRNVIPDMHEKVKVARAILESYGDVRDFDPREQRWTIMRRAGRHILPAAFRSRRIVVTLTPSCSAIERRLPESRGRFLSVACAPSGA